LSWQARQLTPRRGTVGSTEGRVAESRREKAPVGAREQRASRRVNPSNRLITVFF